jgi:2-polyprenyl-3-methyl-5-hydroxy-6-metoxy-1,4-benzoquinol methylase
MNFDKIIETQKDPFKAEESKDEKDSVLEQIEKYHWKQSIEVLNGISTKGSFENRSFILKQFGLIDFKDKNVLDVGCADGFYSFEAERRGAKTIIGIDKNKSKGLCEFLMPFFKSKIKMEEVDFFDYKPKNKFDIIIFTGILYNVKYPLLALEVVSSWLKEGGSLIVESAMYSDDNKKAVLYCPSPEENPYKDPNAKKQATHQNTFFNHKGLIDNLEKHNLKLINIYPDNRRGTSRKNIYRDSFLFNKIK